ncbi:hypothetical protein B0T26DRAFT_169255 [Lasiosphaeria miniovina]|uniref:Uncharacterized protein n=1 Tax=Lasiosphaeria miniovina TaxID=1954250 RepID=A0AA40B621_9PEZI|nr:uncharacterized protein B0T26DRAFT_169255 [Lasiosphaeria miniovina]KAK0728386.1 hypothetical protein B0T26DRAFT_169255 [Lasiosphaeria miniovina]
MRCPFWSQLCKHRPVRGFCELARRQCVHLHPIFSVSLLGATRGGCLTSLLGSKPFLPLRSGDGNREERKRRERGRRSQQNYEVLSLAWLVMRWQWGGVVSLLYASHHQHGPSFICFLGSLAAPAPYCYPWKGKGKWKGEENAAVQCSALPSNPCPFLPLRGKDLILASALWRACREDCVYQAPGMGCTKGMTVMMAAAPVCPLLFFAW